MMPAMIKEGKAPSGFEKDANDMVIDLKELQPFLNQGFPAVYEDETECRKAPERAEIDEQREQKKSKKKKTRSDAKALEESSSASITAAPAPIQRPLPDFSSALAFRSGNPPRDT